MAPLPTMVDHGTHDPDTGKLYISELQERILTAHQNGSGVETVLDLPATSHPVGIYIKQQKIFWTEKLDRTINRTDINGLGSNAIVTDTDARKITGHDSFIYWAEHDTNSVKKAAIDGSGVSTVISGLHKVRAITIDENERVLYAANYVGETETENARIMRYDLDTNDQSDIYNAGIKISDITILGDLLLFVDDSSLNATNKNGSSLVPLNVTGLDCTGYLSVHVLNSK
ncbi:uncharacterized protein [Amphiura filiformis]|uniref:uncharacterized protein n=1 Tax=Amphiura filiformis TaxID=82378 RepID=UPI003B228E2E